MAKKKLHPALFATIVMSPVIVLQFLFPIMGIGAMPSSDIVGVLAIDAICWLLIFFIWHLTSRRRPS